MEQKQPRWRRVLHRLPAFLVAVGAIGWFGSFAVSMGGRHFIPDSMQLPLSQPEGLAVDAKGTIYVACGFYRRVQVYDAEGRFLRGWFLPDGHKYDRLRISEDQKVEAVSSGYIFRLTPQGEVVSSHAETDTTHESIPGFAATGSGAVRFEIRDLITPQLTIYPRIARIGPNGEATTVVATPWYLWPFQGVLPAFGWAAIGILSLMLRNLTLRPHPLV